MERGKIIMPESTRHVLFGTLLLCMLSSCKTSSSNSGLRADSIPFEESKFTFNQNFSGTLEIERFPWQLFSENNLSVSQVEERFLNFVKNAVASYKPNDVFMKRISSFSPSNPLEISLSNIWFSVGSNEYDAYLSRDAKSESQCLAFDGTIAPIWGVSLVVWAVGGIEVKGVPHLKHDRKLAGLMKRSAPFLHWAVGIESNGS